jgi:hypothetical protein
MTLRISLAAAVLAAVATLTLPAPEARACGCFAPPNPAVPVVQAGERIVFAHEDGEVVAHIQIQYEGDASEFGWLLPVPAVPEFALGTDELFTQILRQTQPRYRLNTQFPDQCGGPVFAGGPGRDSASEGGNGGNGGPLVVEDSVGPYDYAVLKADDDREMFDWLVDNSYFIPTGTEDVVGPYIRPGAYFLALKLRSGESAGNLQPIVLRYRSDYPMIPIILTSVAANPDMGVQVWVLGEDRAIPRNYRHTVLNDEKIDWFNAGQNYNDVVIAATNEAEDGQSFVTEYAGTSAVMRDVLAPGWRFGDRASFEAAADPIDFVEQMWSRNFPVTTPVLTLLERDVPVPDYWAEQNIDGANFYQSIRFWMQRLETEAPEAHAAYLSALDFDAEQLAADLWERVVEPSRAADALFDRHEKLTRLYTTLSPNEMTRDPVFAFNPDLPDVSNQHDATFLADCDGAGGLLTLPDGRTLRVEDPSQWSASRDEGPAPFSRRIELLREEGAPMIAVDNRGEITPSYDDGGCTCVREARGLTPSALAVMLLLGLAMFRRRRV